MQYKKQIILSILTIFVLSALIIGATFSYFQAQGDTSSQTSATVKTYTTDVFSFETGDAISFSLNQENFTSGKGNQTGSTFAKTILTANNKTNTATEHYYLYLNISNNTFTYTQNENTPEILLTITDGTNPVTNLTSLTYKTVTDGKGNRISGYDITNKKGLITLFSNREITTTSTKTENWNITVTFINYNIDQSKNAGKTFSGKVLIQKEKIKETIATVCSNGQTLSSCIIAMDGKDDTLYHHTSSLANGAGDNSYRYAGANPNNYVCFGSDASTCPEDNLYRIIGVFGNQVKLIKATIAKSNLLGTAGAYVSDTTYEWSSLISCPSSTAYNSSNGIYQLANKNIIAAPEDGGCDEWNYSDLNTTNLNTNFIKNIRTIWAEKIATTTWKVGGNTMASVPATTYQYEIGSSASSKTHDAKIGLMYVSDYGFAADQSAWTTKLDSYKSNVSKNWLYLGLDEWTISRDSSYSDYAFVVTSDGVVNSDFVSSYFGVRPSFSLLSSITYVSGSGSMSDPVRIN